MIIPSKLVSYGFFCFALYGLIVVYSFLETREIIHDHNHHNHNHLTLGRLTVLSLDVNKCK